MPRIRSLNRRLEFGNLEDPNVESAVAKSSGQILTYAPATRKDEEQTLSLPFQSTEALVSEVPKAQVSEVQEDLPEGGLADIPEPVLTLAPTDFIPHQDLVEEAGGANAEDVGGDQAEVGVEGKASGENHQAGKRVTESQLGRFRPKVKLTVDTSAIRNLVVAEHLAWHMHLLVDIEAYRQLEYADAFLREICHHAERVMEAEGLVETLRASWDEATQFSKEKEEEAVLP
ncbi:hypothetical protein NE237_014352 [Protea cynaroides]|uniref:Uncharacterized protein n=1 Tax=Protea cynaroides TaxID=273540 RepID=A0A9Q0KC56_9MAGN|nr:hypothetical protein NE237_014352 [Protea cynaroides]